MDDFSNLYRIGSMWTRRPLKAWSSWVHKAGGKWELVDLLELYSMLQLKERGASGSYFVAPRLQWKNLVLEIRLVNLSFLRIQNQPKELWRQIKHYVVWQWWHMLKKKIFSKKSTILLLKRFFKWLKENDILNIFLQIFFEWLSCDWQEECLNQPNLI